MPADDYRGEWPSESDFGTHQGERSGKFEAIIFGFLLVMVLALSFQAIPDFTQVFPGLLLPARKLQISPVISF